jgi:hypothetical protein
MPQQIRDSAFFSAGVTDAAYLAQQQASIRDMIARARATNEAGESYWKMDRGQFVKQLRLMGEAVGVPHPNGPREGGIKEQDITDPISIARLKLVVNTQLEMAYGQGQYLAAMDPDILSEWPAWELVRITPKKAPRDWFKRWLDAGGTLHDGLMIALKTDPIWSAISRFGKPHPPFDYNSGMGVEEIDHDTAEHLGLLGKPATASAGKGKANQAPLNKPLSALEDDLQASVSGMDDGMRKRLQSVFGDQVSIDGDAAKWIADAPAEDDTVKVREANPQPPREPEKIPTKPQNKHQVAHSFAKEFGCKVSFKPMADGVSFGEVLTEPEAILHMQTIAEEWRRVRQAFPALQRPGIVHTFMCVDHERGLANQDGPAPHLSTKAKGGSDEQWSAKRDWEQVNKRSYGVERQGRQIADNFRHELAHTLSTPAVMDAFRREVLSKLDLDWFRQHMSEYAYTHESEAVAEAFAIGTQEDYVRGTLPPELEHFVFEIMLGGHI